MGTEIEEPTDGVSWPQRLLDRVWLLALVAILYWALSYIVWGIVDILAVPMG